MWLLCDAGPNLRAVLDHALTQRTDGRGAHNDLLSEVDETSIPQVSASTARYDCPINWLPTSKWALSR
jgi:hypothetical protein